MPGEDATADLERWWQEVEPALLRHALSYTRDRDSARELVQDVAILALRHERFASYGEFQAWAHIRLRWLALDSYRRTQRTFHTFGTVSGEPADETALDRLNQRLTLEKLIGGLPERQKLVITRHLRGESTHDIAVALGISDATVRSLLRFARFHLFERLQSEGADL